MAKKNNLKNLSEKQEVKDEKEVNKVEKTVKKIMTVDELKKLPLEEIKKIEILCEKGEVEVVNH